MADIVIEHIKKLEINWGQEIVKLQNLIEEYPYPDLLPAILAILDAVEDGKERGQEYMPTATGKTLVIEESTRLLIEYFGMKSFVMTGSTIELSLQHINVFESHLQKAKGGSIFSKTKLLLVCSDKELKRYLEEGDRIEDVTTDPERVSKFIQDRQEDGCPYIIISTYHSLDKVVGTAYKNVEDHTLDVTFYDEAHNATNNQFSSTVYKKEENLILTDTANYQSKFRFFLTATPRATIHINEEKGEKVGTREVGMDKEDVYGEVIYQMTLAQAISKGMIVPPTVIIPQVEKGFEDFINKCWLVPFIIGDSKFEFELKTEASLLAGGVSELYKKAGKVKTIVYCRSVKHAEHLHTNLNWSTVLNIPGLQTFFVASKLNGAERKAALEGFSNAENAIIFNYRILSEGINIEDVNSIVTLRAFEDAITLAQAIGRALRLDSKDRIALKQGIIKTGTPAGWKKPFGYAIIPESMGRSQDKEYVLGRSIDYIKTLYNSGFTDLRIMGFSLENPFGEIGEKRLKEFAREKYDIDYVPGSIKSLLDLYEKIGKTDWIEVMTTFLESDKEEDKEKLGLDEFIF